MREIVAFIFGLALLGNAALFVPQAIAVWRKKSDEAFRWSPSAASACCRLSGSFTASTSTTIPLSSASAPASLPAERSPSSRSSTVSAVCAPSTTIRRPDLTTGAEQRHMISVISRAVEGPVRQGCASRGILLFHSGEVPWGPRRRPGISRLRPTEVSMKITDTVDQVLRNKTFNRFCPLPPSKAFTRPCA